MRWLVVLMVVIAGVPCAAAQEAGIMTLRGFQIDGRLLTEKKLKALLPSLNVQIDIVERAQVPAEMLEFFRTIPVIYDPKLRGSKGHAQRVEGRQIVTLQDEKLPSDRPILLHELIHGYFAVKLRGHTPAIPKAFQEAQSTRYFPKDFYKAHFMENPNEFFTVVSSTYLFGKIDQPPYTCAIIAKHQPEFIAFLETQFGPHECK